MRSLPAGSSPWSNISTTRAPRMRARAVMISDIAELERQIDTYQHRDREPRESVGQGTLHDRMAITRTVTRVPANTALISYWLGAESAYAWVVVPEAIRWTRLSSPEDISRAGTRVSPLAEPDLRRPGRGPLAGFARAEWEGFRSDRVAARECCTMGVHSRWRAGLRAVRCVDDIGGYSRMRFVIVRHDVAVTPAAWMLDTRSDRSDAAAATRAASGCRPRVPAG